MLNLYQWSTEKLIALESEVNKELNNRYDHNWNKIIRNRSTRESITVNDEDKNRILKKLERKKQSSI